MNIFDGAIAALEKHGWGRGVAQDHEGRLCLLGAVYRAAGWRLNAQREDWDVEAATDAYMFLAHRPALVAGVVRFNDKIAQDVDDVIHQLKLASEAWDLEHPA